MTPTPNLRTVVELDGFEKAAAFLAAEDRVAIATAIAEYPEAGDIIRGAGGARKLRWAVGARGKSGGVRVIYYVGAVVIYLLALYTKGAKSDLTQREITLLHRICKVLP